MIKCDECGDEITSYYEDGERKLCFICYHKLHTFKGKNEKTKQKEKAVSTAKVEKWIVLKHGNEEVWTMSKVNNQIQSGRTTMKISFSISIIVFLIWFLQSYSANASINEILSDYFNPLLWICTIFNPRS